MIINSLLLCLWLWFLWCICLDDVPTWYNGCGCRELAYMVFLDDFPKWHFFLFSDSSWQPCAWQKIILWAFILFWYHFLGCISIGQWCGHQHANVFQNPLIFTYPAEFFKFAYNFWGTKTLLYLFLGCSQEFRTHQADECHPPRKPTIKDVPHQRFLSKEAAKYFFIIFFWKYLFLGEKIK